MKAIDALHALLGRVGACRDAAVLVNEEELLRWPKAAVKAMKSQKLIVKARPATTAICPGCEEHCVMPVHTLPSTRGKPSFFIVCDKRSDINRVPVPAERLMQWQCNADSVSGFVALSFGLRSHQKKADSAGRREIGVVCGEKRCQMLCLETSGTLTLIVGNSKVPLGELVEFRNGLYSLDTAFIRQMADSATTADDRYTPSQVKRENRKRATQAMYQQWQNAYQALRRSRPGMSDVWYSLKIAKTDIAQDHDSETIRKRMKG